MNYKGVNITLDNYKEIFSVCTPDILDEIRLAILDGTDIMAYILPCGKDNYKLGQFRLAIREGLPYHLLIPSMSGKTVNLLRLCYNQHNGNISQLAPYIRGGRLHISSDMFENIVQCILFGGDISRVDFTKVKEENCKVICQGLVRKYPMWLFAEENFTVGYIDLLMRALSLGIDISLLIETPYSETQLVVILAYAEYSSILKYITPKFSPDAISIILRASKKGYDITQLVYKDVDGYPLYNDYQMEMLYRALKLQSQGINTYDVFNPNLSDKEMEDMLDLLEYT